MDAEKTGKLIKELRTEKGLTQQELASLLKVSPTAVSKWENGKNLPDISVMEAMAEILNVSCSEIISGERTPQPVPDQNAGGVKHYITGLFFPLFALFAFAAARKGILLLVSIGAFLLQLVVNAAIERSGRRKGIPEAKRHLIKLVFAILLNVDLLAVHGLFDLSDTSGRRRLFLFAVVGLALLIRDILIVAKKKPEDTDEREKSGLAQYAKFVLYLVLSLVLIVVINIAVIRFGPAKAPYFWASQIETAGELEALDDAVVLFGEASAPVCIDAEHRLRGLPKRNRQALYYCDTDKLRRDDAFQEILQKWHVESAPALVVIIDGSWIDSFRLVGDDGALDENAIDEAYYMYFLGTIGS